MSNREVQDEEKEVLLSIYEGDGCFKSLSDTTYQYKVGEDGHFQSILLEISWPDEYPDQVPIISLDAFYNNHLIKPVKDNIISLVKTEAEQWLGSAMTYTLFEFAKENAEDFMKHQVLNIKEEQETKDTTNHIPEAKKKVKKEQLTKAQKRKLADKVDHRGERQRGWDWVDVIKHLSKTGSAESN